MPDNKKELMMYRMAGAKEKLNSSKLLLDNGNYKDSIGRSYYAMFSAVRAILALDGVDYSKHAGVIACFQKEAKEQYEKADEFVKVVEAYLEHILTIQDRF